MFGPILAKKSVSFDSEENVNIDNNISVLSRS